MRPQKLLTQEILRKLPALGAMDGSFPSTVPIVVKFFNPCGAATWYAIEYDPESREFFGYVDLGDPMCAELGYFSLDELESIRLPMGLKIERDAHFGEHYLSEVLDGKRP